MTLYEEALKAKVNPGILEVSRIEKVDVKIIMKTISKGHSVIMKRKDSPPLGIGMAFRTKINVNIGTSASLIELDEEIEKLKVAQKYGADTISDLSMGGNIDTIRRTIINSSIVPITTVPIYQAVAEAKSIINVTEDKLFKIIRKQIKDGISSIVLHCAFSLSDLEKMKGKRIMGIVSKGGSFTATLMMEQSIENPFLKNFDYLMDILRENDIVLNLGNSLRSGCIHDEVDAFQLSEVKLNAKLAKRANSKGIQVIIESLGGHVMVKNLIEKIQLYKKITNNRPLFVSGPLPTDFAPGYDHIVAAIGGAFAAGYGADYLCAITPAEHLCLPSVKDIKKGIIACKIAAHVGDSMKFGLNHLFNNDLYLSQYRYQKNWQKQFEYSLDPEEPSKKHPVNQDLCSMCGEYCALSLSKRFFSSNTKNSDRK